MMNRLTISALVLAATVPFTATRISAEGYTAPTELERLEKSVKDDQAALKYAGVGMSLRNAQIEKERAHARLANDQAALDAFKTAGPQATKLAQLEAAVKRDQEALKNAGIGGTKMVYAQQERQSAREALARDQAALEAFKTAGPKSEIPALEKAVRNDEAALRYAGVGEKMVYAQQSRAAALRRLEVDRAALEALKSQYRSLWRVVDLLFHPPQVGCEDDYYELRIDPRRPIGLSRR